MTVLPTRLAPSRWHRAAHFMRAVRPRHLGWAFLSLFLLTILICALAPSLVAPQDPYEQSLLDRNLQPWSTASDELFHVLGTDPLGRDVLSRLIYGARITLIVGFASVLVSSLIGIPLGLIAGYRGNKTDTVIMRFVDAMLSFPFLIIAIFFLYVAGGGVVQVIVILAAIRWVAYTRVTRGLVLPYRSSAMVEGMRSIGCGDGRIMFRHVLPNIFAPLMVLALLEMSLVILAEASISFLGLGVPPPQPSWGIMVAEGRDYLTTAPWTVMFPGLVITLTTMAVSVAARGLRAHTDSGGLRRVDRSRRRLVESEAHSATATHAEISAK